MADESMDVDAFDTEAVHGGGGYVDDDIDLDDDDDDDEPLLASGSRSGPLSSPTVGKGQKRRAKASSSSLLPELKKRKKDTAHPDDFLLRRAGTSSLRDYIVAKYITRVPDFTDDPHVRLYRDTEPTVRGRERAIERGRKEKIYYNSFSGKRRQERYEKQGIVTIPDRYKNGWTMEVTPKHLVEEKKRRSEAAKATAAQKPETANGVVDPSPGVNGVTNEEPNSEQKTEQDPDVDVFDGQFDGKSTSRYAIMVMTEGSKAVDVIPIDDYSWCSFRAVRSQGADNAEATEAKMRKLSAKRQNRLAKFSTKLEDAQLTREQGMGDNSRIVNSKEYAGVGIKRSNTKHEDDIDNTMEEELDFEQEFEDDDVAQIDKETVKKTENRVGDAEQNAKDFRKLIKDEPITSRPASPGSDSDEEPTQGQNSRPTSRSPSPSRPASASRSPNRSIRSTPAVGSRQPTPMGTSPYGSTPLGISPSPGQSPRGNTPQKLDLSHLLPPPGTLPTPMHIKAVLSVLLKTREKIMFKEFLQYFEMKSKGQKDNLIRLMKAVATVTQEMVDKRKTVYISWKKPQLPAGPSGK